MTAGLSECPPFILVARHKPGLPLASPPSRWTWLVERVLFAGALKGAILVSETEMGGVREC